MRSLFVDDFMVAGPRGTREYVGWPSIVTAEKSRDMNSFPARVSGRYLDD
jgi:hypothetical protein